MSRSPRHRARLSFTSNTARELGGVFGIAVLGAVLTARRCPDSLTDQLGAGQRNCHAADVRHTVDAVTAQAAAGASDTSGRRRRWCGTRPRRRSWTACTWRCGPARRCSPVRRGGRLQLMRPERRAEQPVEEPSGPVADTRPVAA
ncbi:hypothetical protein ACU686_18410 [Yinghuangia aomiensis]